MLLVTIFLANLFRIQADFLTIEKNENHKHLIQPL